MAAKFLTKCHFVLPFKNLEATLLECVSLAFDILIGLGVSMVIIRYLVRCIISLNAGSGQVL